MVRLPFLMAAFGGLNPMNVRLMRYAEFVLLIGYLDELAKMNEGS